MKQLFLVLVLSQLFSCELDTTTPAYYPKEEVVADSLPEAEIINQVYRDTLNYLIDEFGEQFQIGKYIILVDNDYLYVYLPTEEPTSENGLRLNFEKQQNIAPNTDVFYFIGEVICNNYYLYQKNNQIRILLENGEIQGIYQRALDYPEGRLILKQRNLYHVEYLNGKTAASTSSGSRRDSTSSNRPL